jgi:hypothetical protein
MNTNKIVLGASAFVLAIAGAIATKASSKSPSLTGWTRNQTTHKCGTHSFARFCSTSSASAVLCTGAVSGTSRTLYTKISGTNTCISTLKTVAQN